MSVQNTDTDLAALANCPVCPVTDGTEPRMQPGRGWWSLTGPSRILG